MDMHKEPPSGTPSIQVGNGLYYGEHLHHTSDDNPQPVPVGTSLFANSIAIYRQWLQSKHGFRPFGWNKAKWHAVQFIHAVEGHFHKEGSPAFYADHLKLAEVYLREICKRELHQPPHHWINLKRVDASLPLLSGTDLAIKEIAYQVGVEDSSYFARLFKKYMDMPPNDYRVLY